MGTTKVLCSYKYHDESVLVHKDTLKYLGEHQQEVYTHVYE